MNRSPDRGSAVTSGRAVGVARLHHEPHPEQRPLGVDDEARRPSAKVRGHEELDVRHRERLIGVEVLAPGVGVDRHLSRLASTDGGYEVERYPAALLAGELETREAL